MSIKLYKNTQYIKEEHDWSVSKKLYEADRLQIDPEILVPHPIESDPISGSKLRKIREARTKYLNLSEMVVSLWISYLFKTALDLDQETLKMLDGDEKNIDGKGVSLNNFVKNNISVNYLLYGKTAVKVNMAQLTGDYSELQIKENNYRPYWESISALQIKDWQYPEQLSDKRPFDFIRYEYSKSNPRNSETEEVKNHIWSKAYRIDNGEIYCINYKGQEVTNGALALEQTFEPETPIKISIDEIPLVVIDDKSWIRDVDPEIMRYYNLRSNHDNILYNACWPKIFIEVAEMQDVKDMQGYLNENIWNTVKGSVKQIDSPDMTPHRSAMDDSLTSLFRIAMNQSRFISSGSKEVEGADTQREQKENSRSLAESLLQDIEQLVNDALRIHAKYKGVSNFNGRASLNKDFNEFNYESFSSLYGLVINDLRDYPESREQIVKAIIKKVGEELSDPNIDIDKMASEVRKEQKIDINTNPFRGLGTDGREGQGNEREDQEN